MQSRNVSKSSAPMSGSCSRREGGSSRTGDHSSRKDDFASTKRMAPEELHLNGSGVYCNGHLYDVDTLMGSRDELGRVLQELKHESLRAHEAEERAELLAEDNERLRSKATMLSAATGNSAEDLETTTVTELRNQVTALHAHVDDLTQQLEAAATEAQRKEERIRLLERKLADQLLRDDLAGSPYYSRDGSPSNDFHASPRASTGDSLAAHAMDAAPAASKSAVSPRHVLPNHTVDAGTRISGIADVAPARSSVTPPRGHTSVSPSRITPTPIRLGGRQPAQRKASVPRRSPSALRTMSSTTTTAVVAPTSAAPPPRVKPLSLNGSMLLSQQRSYASLDHPMSGRRSGSLVATPVSRVPVQRSSSTVTSGAGRFERDAQRPRSLAARPSSPRVQTEVSERRSASAQPRSSTTASSPRSTRERLYASPTAASSAKMRSSSATHRTAPLQPTASTSTVSPSRSISAMRPSRRPRPQISYNPRNQLSTLKGTTTTVVFRSAKRASREESFQAEPSMAAQ